MNKLSKRTAVIALIIGALVALTILGAPSPAHSAYTETVTVTDWNGDQMILNPNCADLVNGYLSVGQGNTLREMLNDGFTATPEYVEACF